MSSRIELSSGAYLVVPHSPDYVTQQIDDAPEPWLEMPLNAPKPSTDARGNRVYPPQKVQVARFRRDAVIAVWTLLS